MSDPSSQPTQPLTEGKWERLGELVAAGHFDNECRAVKGLYEAVMRERAEVDRLKFELNGCRNLGVEYERLRVENIALADKLTAVRAIKPRGRDAGRTAIGLAEANGWNDAVNAIREAVEPCTCSLTDPSTWTTYGGLTEPGSTYQWEPDCPAHGEALGLDQDGRGNA